MKPHRLHAFRHLFLLLLVSFLPIPSLCAEPAEDAAMQMQAMFGFGGKAKIGFWAPVTATVRYRPLDPSAILDGELVLTAGRQGASDFRIRTRFTMGAGRKTLSLYCLQPDVYNAVRRGPLKLSILDRATGQTLAESPLPDSDSLSNPDAALVEETVLLVRVGAPERSGWLTALATSRQQKLETLYAQDLIANRDVFGHVQASDIEPDNAPDRWIGWQAADIVVWDDPRPEELRPGQLRALEDWVRQGGRLVLVFPEDSPPASLDAIADWLPARVGERTQTLDLPETPDGTAVLPSRLQMAMAGQWMYGPASAADRRPDEAPARAQIRLLHPTRGRSLFRVRATAADPNQPLAVRGAWGQGFVTILAMDPVGSFLKKHPGRPALMGRVLGVSFDPADQMRLRDNAPVNIYGGTVVDLPCGLRFLDMTMEYLAAARELQPIPFGWLVGFLAAYIFLAGPVDFYLLQRFGAMRRTWLTFSICVLGFSALALLGAYEIKGGRSFARSVTVVDHVVGQPHASRSRTFTGLFSSEPVEYDLSFGPDFPMATREHSFSGIGPRMEVALYPSDGGASGLLQQDAMLLEETPIQQWSMKAFLQDGHRVDEGQLAGDLHYEGRVLRGGLLVEAGPPLEDALLVGRWHVYHLGRLSAGTQWNAEEAQPADDFLATMALFARTSSPGDSMLDWRNGGTASARGAIELLETGQWDSRWLAAGSLPKLLRWDLLPRYRIEQMEAPGPAFPSEEESAPSALPLPAGLSLEQCWNMTSRVNERYLSDLSDIVREGGLVLLARQDQVLQELQVQNRQVEREGFSLLRFIFPPAPTAEGGLIWRDDLYRRPYGSINSAADPEGAP